MCRTLLTFIIYGVLILAMVAEQLKSSEYHTTRNEKILTGISGALIGGAIGVDTVFPGHGIEIASTVNKFRPIFISLASVLAGLGGTGAGLALSGVLREKDKARKASNEEKK